MKREWFSKMTLTDVVQHRDFRFAYCTFIDEFKIASNKEEMIKNPPTSNSLIEHEDLCILVAAIHKLANDYKIKVPEWVFESKYKMPNPVFVLHTEDKEYQAMLIKGTPAEFASKNLFLGPRVASRI